MQLSAFLTLALLSAPCNKLGAQQNTHPVSLSGNIQSDMLLPKTIPKPEPNETPTPF